METASLLMLSLLHYAYMTCTTVAARSTDAQMYKQCRSRWLDICRFIVQAKHSFASLSPCVDKRPTWLIYQELHWVLPARHAQCYYSIQRPDGGIDKISTMSWTIYQSYTTTKYMLIVTRCTTLYHKLQSHNTGKWGMCDTIHEVHEVHEVEAAVRLAIMCSNHMTNML
jgi:hypothetical protein